MDTTFKWHDTITYGALVTIYGIIWVNIELGWRQSTTWTDALLIGSSGTKLSWILIQTPNFSLKKSFENVHQRYVGHFIQVSVS